MNNASRIISFKNLDAWQYGHRLVLIIYKETKAFPIYSIALGSTTELQNQLLIAKDVDYIDSDTYDEILELSIIVHKLLNGLIKGARKYA